MPYFGAEAGKKRRAIQRSVRTRLASFDRKPQQIAQVLAQKIALGHAAANSKQLSFKLNCKIKKKKTRN